MKISFNVSKAAHKAADLLAIGSFEGGDTRFKKVLTNKKFSGKDGETFFIPAPLVKGAGAVFLIGLGKKDKFTLEKVRRAAAKFLGQGKVFQYKHLRLDLDSFREKFPLEEIAGAVIEGARLSDYTFQKYKSKPNADRNVEALDLVAAGEGRAASVRRAVAEAEKIAEGVLFVRDLANEPANVMTPVRLARAAKEMAARNNLICRVLGRNEIARLKMGGVLAVSQGSSHPPQFVILENKVKSASRPVVLVGKGVTFDTGGISIKPSNDMDKMKFDMCGAAAVMGAMKVIANLKLPVKVIGITPLVENMPGSKAQRPGDIIRCLNGKTVEVLNTDAEGRLILADALAYAARFKPRALVDLATLTGACAVTFADLAIGLMGTDPDLVGRIKAAGEHTGERCWELPLWDEYADLIKAAYADIQNISKKFAGTITAGMFLKEFADHTASWAHLDIAGTAWNEGGAKPLSPIGATGVGVRLLVQLLKNFQR
ncbi:MAG: leucyl aminopeptidase [Candidatus Omnitrophota bacterium]